MKAVVKVKPEKGAQLQDHQTPKLLPDWVMVRVRATSICGTDVHIYNWDNWAAGRIGARNLPQIMGHELCGEVVEVGPHCTRVKPGAYVSAETHIYNPGDLNALLGQLHVGRHMRILGVDVDGCFAEYVTVPESVCWPNDSSIPPEHTCILEPLGNATYAVLGEDNDVAGKTMLITGDGPISLFAIAVARACGVAKIIHFGYWDFNCDLGRRLGADLQLRVDGTTPEQRMQFVFDHTGGNGVDVALEMVGNQTSITDCINCVRKGGRLSAFGINPESTVPVSYNDGIVFKGLTIVGISGRKIFDTWYRNQNLLANGRLDPGPVITHMFTLNDFQRGFDAMLATPRTSAKVVLFPDPAELAAALSRRSTAT